MCSGEAGALGSHQGFEPLGVRGVFSEILGALRGHPGSRGAVRHSLVHPTPTEPCPHAGSLSRPPGAVFP